MDCTTTPVSNANAGNDNLNGGPGDDLLFGDQKNDVLIGGPGEDFLSGEENDDRIFARDGEADQINCGPGVDRVQWDKGLDTFRNSNNENVGTDFPSNCEGELLVAALRRAAGRRVGSRHGLGSTPWSRRRAIWND